MTQFAGLLRAELRVLMRNKIALFFTIFFPLVSLLLLGSVFGGRGDTFKTKLTVVDLDHTPASRAFVARLGTPYTKVRQAPPSRAAALRSEPEGLVVVIPQGYAAALDGSRPPAEVQTFPESEDVVSANTVVRGAVQTASYASEASGPRAVLVPRVVGDTGVKYINFLFPGLLGMTLAGGAYMGAAEPAARRELGIMRHLFSTPLRAWPYVSAWITSHIVFFIPQVVLMTIVATAVMGFSAHISIPAALVLVVLGSWTFLSLGAMIATFVRRAATSSVIATAVMMPMYFLGEAFFPVPNSSPALSALRAVIPLSHLNAGLRAAFAGGKGILGVLPQIAVLAAWAAGSGAIVAWRAGRKRVFMSEQWPAPRVRRQASAA